MTQEMQHSPSTIQPIDVNAQNFDAEVVQASMQNPVILDFWAPWCEPCKQIMPALESAVANQNGAVKLVKINIEENKMLAQQMQVQSVPTVFAVYKGKPVDGFAGAMSPSDIVAFVEKIVTETGATANPTGTDIPAVLEQAESHMTDRDFAQALPLYMQILEADETHNQALAGMALCYIDMGECDAAQNVLEMGDAHDGHIIRAVKALAIAQNAGDATELDALQFAYKDAVNTPDAGFEYATALFAHNQHQESIALLLELYKADKNWKEGIVKAELLKYFEVLGFDNPVTIHGRKKLSALMFV